MATNTRKRIRESDSDANPERSSTVPKKGKTNKKLSKREREEIACSLKQIYLVVLSDEVSTTRFTRCYSFTGISAVDIMQLSLQCGTVFGFYLKRRSYRRIHANHW